MVISLRREGERAPVSASAALGHSRRSDGQQGFAECPLCLQNWRPDPCVATNRQKVPIAAASRCSERQPYSITSSARRSSAVGTVRPNILAAFRLIMSSTPVG